ncbi:MAG TPA: YdeI/OmpD-associated family protein [Flavitalea sp.]|nr:YdeI/OmpD-associated family protein [Flavitalea sp.]
MSSSLHSKLRLKPGLRLLTVNAPGDFSQSIDAASLNLTISRNAKAFDQIHWFVKTKKELEADLTKIINLLKEGVICWIYYPKGSSKIQTDLTRDKGWDLLLKQPNLKWLVLVSFDETWSAFSMRLKTAEDQQNEKATKVRPIFDYIDPVKKIIRIPDDLQKLLDKHKKEAEFFGSLSFSNKKEYVEWIVTAKKEETRKTRVEETIVKLAKKLKNP